MRKFTKQRKNKMIEIAQQIIDNAKCLIILLQEEGKKTSGLDTAGEYARSFIRRICCNGIEEEAQELRKLAEESQKMTGLEWLDECKTRHKYR